MSLNNWIRGLVLSDAVIMLLQRIDLHPEEFETWKPSRWDYVNQGRNIAFNWAERRLIQRKMIKIARRVMQEKILKEIIAPDEKDKTHAFMGRVTASSNSPFVTMQNTTMQAGELTVDGTVRAKKYEIIP